MSSAKMPKRCQGTGGIRRGGAEEQSGDERVMTGTEQQQSKELENEEQEKEKAKASTAQLSQCGQHTGRGMELGSASWKACWHKLLVCCGAFCIVATSHLSSLILASFHTRVLLNRSHLWKVFDRGKACVFSWQVGAGSCACTATCKSKAGCRLPGRFALE